MTAEVNLLLRSQRTEKVQPGAGHHLMFGLSSMKLRLRNLLYWAKSSGETMRLTASSCTRSLHLGRMHLATIHSAPSRIFI